MFMHKYPGLDELDFEILRLVKSKGKMSEAEIISHFSKSEPGDIKGRLEALSEIEQYQGQSVYMKMKSSGSGFLKKDHSFRGAGIGYAITPRGRVAAEDYDYRRNAIRRERRADFIWKAVTVFAAVLAAIGALGAWREEIFRFFRFLSG